MTLLELLGILMINTAANSHIVVREDLIMALNWASLESGGAAFTQAKTCSFTTYASRIKVMLSPAAAIATS